MLLQLLADIDKQKGAHAITVNIINDRSGKDYTSVVSYLKGIKTFRYSFAETTDHCGKAQYWILVDFLFKLQKTKFDYLIQIPDDIRLTPKFFDTAIGFWEGITDKRKACLNLLNDYGREGKNVWTGTKIKDMGSVLETGWVDMCYIAGKMFLDALDYKVTPVSQVWTASENHSSGVGMQISLRLRDKGMHIYQVKKSLVIHGPHQSVMHPNHRQQFPIISNHISDRITASMATMPERMNACEQVVASILPQVNELQIYLNSFDFIPEFLKNEKIKLFKSHQHAGDIGDVGKFYDASRISGYHFTIDDDIIYPADYCSQMIACIEQYKRECIVTIHGRMFKTMPVDSYYHNNAEVYHCAKGQQKDFYIHIPGTGVMAYHTDTIRFNVDMFQTSNMADIWTAVAAQANGVPVLAMKHLTGWIKLAKIDESRSIYSSCNKNDKVQTEIVNAVAWKLHKAVL